MVPDEDQGLILFKDGKYVAFKFDLLDWKKFKEAIERGKRELEVSDGQAGGRTTV